MRIRIATKALPKVGVHPDNMKSLDDVIGGVKIPWVELDGHRYDELTDAAIEVKFGHSQFQENRLSFGLIGPVEIVYLHGDVEIGSVVADLTKLPDRMDSDTLVPPPDEVRPALPEPSHDTHIIVATTELMTDPEGPWVAWLDGGSNLSARGPIFGQTRGGALRALADLLDADG